MSKKQDELNRLKSEGQKLESEKADLDEKLQGLDPEKNKDEYHRIAQEAKQKGEEIGTNKQAVSNQLSEVAVAKKASAEKEAKEAVGQLKEQVLEAKEAEAPNHPPSIADPSKADAREGKLDQNIAQGIESTQQGPGNNYQKTNNGLTDIQSSQQKAQQQARGELEGKGITAEQEKGQQQEMEMDDDR